MSANCFLISKPAALLKVTGEDAFDYLQSQFSNDLRHPGIESPVTYGLWLDQKGRVQADSFILQTGEEAFLLLSYCCQSAELIATIESNIIADEVEIEDITESASLASFWGDGAAAMLPPDGQFTTDASSYCFAGRRSQTSGEVIFLDKSVDECRIFDESWTEVGSEEADLERIRSGIPAIPQDIGPTDLPQEAGLEKEAVSFNKGCYLGQEVMARLHAMGKAQRALYRITLPEITKSLPCPIFSGEKKAGELRSAHGLEGLALLKRRVVDAKGTLHLEGLNEKTINVL